MNAVGRKTGGNDIDVDLADMKTRGSRLICASGLVHGSVVAMRASRHACYGFTQRIDFMERWILNSGISDWSHCDVLCVTGYFWYSDFYGDLRRS